MIGSLARLLDPRDGEYSSSEPILDAVNIPFSELPGRTHELPPKNETIQVAAVGPFAEETVAWLGARGRHAALANDFAFGRGSKGRLWRPNAFLLECVAGMEPGNALDLGCGAGRDAVALAAAGWRVVGVDRLPDALARGRDLAERYLSECDAARITWMEADLDVGLLEGGGYDLVTAFFHYRPGLVPRMAALLRPGGSLLIETFTPAHAEQHGKPGPARVAGAEELRRQAGTLAIRGVDEGPRGDRHTARLWAVRPPS